MGSASRLNMYTLYIFGPRVEHAWSAGEFTRFYLLCGRRWFFHLLFADGAADRRLGGARRDARVRRRGGPTTRSSCSACCRSRSVVGLVVVNIVGGMAESHGGRRTSRTSAVWRRVAADGGGRRRMDRFRQRVSSAPDIPDETPRVVPRSLPRAREKGNEIDEIIARKHAAVSRRQAPPVAVKTSPRADE